MPLHQIRGGVASANPGMTTMLALRYRRRCRPRRAYTAQPSRWRARTRARGTIVASGEPDRVLVEAETEIASITGELSRRLFGEVVTRGARPSPALRSERGQTTLEG